MQFPIVREYKTDFDRSNPENEIEDEPVKVEAGIASRIFVPRHAPFFADSLSMKFANGAPMALGVDYDVYRIMPKLTSAVRASVACMVILKNLAVTDALISYHTVGEFPLIDNDLMGLITGAVNDTRPVFWENIKDKPPVFPPLVHGHSILYEIMAFQDVIFLLDIFLEEAKTNKNIAEFRLDNALSLLDHYITVYGDMLTKYLEDHKDTINAHGLTAAQVDLGLVDNFATASAVDALQGRDDMHLRPKELETLTQRFSFNRDEFLEDNRLPIAQYGNTNFIPPNIDGSFEGFGGISETAGICMESDGSIVYLWNRMDGRTTGLYYSVLNNAGKPNAKLSYTGYKYEHPRFIADGASVNLIAQGSGSEVILVGDSYKNLFYLGMTNGTLDPSKHTYAKLDLTPILTDLFNFPGSHVGSELFPVISVALMAGYVYIIQSSSTPTPLDWPNLTADLRYKFFYRVPVSQVLSQSVVTPVRQNVSYMDADGVQRNNQTHFRWCDKIVDGNGHVSKCMYTFPLPADIFIGMYRCTPAIVAQDPKRPTIYAMKFLAAFYAANSLGVMNDVAEINYDFNPATGVMTRTSLSAQYEANFANNPVVPVEHTLQFVMMAMVFVYAGQGLAALDNGDIAHSGSPSFSGFPRLGWTVRPPNSKSRHTTTQRFWNNGFEFDGLQGLVPETLVSPLESSTNQRALLYTPTGEFYIAAGKSQQTLAELFYRQVSGRFALRPEVTNLTIPNVVSRPLTANIRKVNALPGMGGATCVVPTSALTGYGVSVGDGGFCMSAQTKHFDRTKVGTQWTANAGADDILLINSHTQTVEADGTVSIVPVSETIYPASIIANMKTLVEFVPKLNAARKVFVTICDPTFTPMCARFGWLPPIVCIQYLPAFGDPDQSTLFSTFMTIQPTYNLVNGRQVVTAYTVLDRFHDTAVRYGFSGRYEPHIWGDEIDVESSISNHSAMRTYYYLDGVKLKVYMRGGIMTFTTTDAGMVDFGCDYTDRGTKRWDNAYTVPRGTGDNISCITPDNGIGWAYLWTGSTGGAALIQQGTVNNALVASAYPETGWIIYFANPTQVVFFGKAYTLPMGTIDLRDIAVDPSHKTFYVYAYLEDGEPKYSVTQEKQLESAFKLWVAVITTDALQILTIERFNVVALDGHRISETKRGNSIPASSGGVNTEGQLPWLRTRELLP